MDIDNHTLLNEFPQYRDRIHALKTGDRHFARLFDEYNTLDREVRRLEGAGSPRADETMEELKRKRVGLKDTLYRMLQA